MDEFKMEGEIGRSSIEMKCKYFENAKMELESQGIVIEERLGKGGHFLSFVDLNSAELYFYHS